MSQPTSADPRSEPLPPADGPALPMPSWPQGVDLPEDQQTFFFQRGDLFFQRVAAALIIRDR